MLLASAVASLAQGSDPIGLNALRAFDPTLTGSGIAVVQAEAGMSNYEVNPSAVGQPAGKFFYTGTDGTTSTQFSSSEESSHADSVGDIFYGDTDTANPEGVAPGVSTIYNYEADYFVNTVINNGVAIPARIVNQSFVALTSDNAEQEQVEEIYDDYAASTNTLFISGVGNGGQVYSPGSCYNGIGVAAYGSGATSSVGPTYDGRSKPDITAPAGATSFSTPQVSGAAAILLQAAGRGDAGAGTETDASDARVLKALLLNGAVKPQGWSNTPTAPLDTRYGAGILNVYNSYMNLRAGECASSGSTSGSAGSINLGTIVPDEGWDLATISNAQVSGSYVTESNHYLFDLSAATAPDFQLTCTLTWWKQVNQTAINNLDLYLFDATTGAMIDCSDSTVDNVQELYPMLDGEPAELAPGEYDIVVAKDGGAPISDGGPVVSSSETYALAFNFAPVPEPSARWLLLPSLAFLLIRHRKTAREFASRGNRRILKSGQVA
jgi:hypothetical protein